jgi:hypothetical protein
MRSAKATMRVQETWSSRLQTQASVFPYDVICLRDGDRWGYQEREPSRQQPEKFFQVNFYWRDDEGVQFNSISDKNSKQVSNAILAAGMLSPAVSGTREVFDRFWPTANLDALCFGLLDGQPLCSPDGLLANGKIIGSADGLVIVEGNSRYGKLTLSCDPNRNFLPQRVEFIQNPDHYRHGQRIGDRVMNAGNVWPAGRVKELRRVIDMHFGQLEPNPSRPYISGWKMIETTDCEAGVVVTRAIQAEVTSIELGQAGEANDFLFGLKIPQWQPVQVEGAGHLSYVWDGNWAVPDAAGLAPSTLASRRTLRWTVGIVIVVSLLAFVCIRIVKRYAKTRSA